MEPQGRPGWLGYALDRSRGQIGVGGLGDRVLLLGRRAGDLATLVAYAFAEEGRRIVLLDVDGSISPEIRGYFRVFDYRSMLYEAFHLEGEDATHGQLVAAAYATALDLTSEEEAILSAALQKLEEQNDMATPSSLFDVLGSVEGFRGFYVDKLKGRIGALKLLETTRVESFDELMNGRTMVSFDSAPYPQASELTAGLFIAKILYLLNRSERRPDGFLITGAHRLFRPPPSLHHCGRLIAHLLEAPVPLVMATPMPALLNEKLIESMAVRIYTSEAWNSRKDPREAAALAYSYTICDDRSGVSIGFVPRFVRPKRSTGGPPPPRHSSRASPELTRTILEEISRYDLANRQSVVSYLTPTFLAVDIGAEMDRLHSEGYLVLEPKRVGSGPRILAYTLTESGRRLLLELTNYGTPQD
ncbi:MAG TPA: hypothetical protein VED22_07895 [Nitrososphaerales archaeon]|nr:hypothetical protein [Nitrososphaerales archaeon]